MDYISITEAADKWGIPAAVCRYSVLKIAFRG